MRAFLAQPLRCAQSFLRRVVHWWGKPKCMPLLTCHAVRRAVRGLQDEEGDALAAALEKGAKI